MLERNIRHAQPRDRDTHLSTQNVVEPPEKLRELRLKKGSAGWTVKGVPAEVVAMTRRAASHRGMHIGSWVAENLKQAADRELDETVPVVEARSEEILRKIDDMVELLREGFKQIGDHNQVLDQELAVIRRGLLPRIYSGGK